MRHRAIYFCRMAFLLAVFATMTFAHTHPTPVPSPSLMGSPAAAHEDHAGAVKEPVAIISEFPNYHPLVVHFPIVLLLIAALFQLLSFLFYRKEFSLATLILLLMGAAAVWLASNTFHADAKDLAGPAAEIFRQHELLAEYTSWLAVAGLVAKTASHFFLGRKWWSEAIVTLLLIGCSVTVAIAGHHGAQLVHIEGVGPQGKYLEMEGH